MVSRYAGVSDAAVRKATGRSWKEWFVILDAAGAMKMSHRKIAAYLSGVQGVSGWWSQTVANGYERERGLRQKHQMPDGYQVSVSKTVQAPLAALYQGWVDETLRSRWLIDYRDLAFRKATPNKSLRITWLDGETSVEVNFYDRGEARSQAVVQHSKLASLDAAETMKAYWREALERLKLSLESA